jgi:hypothetical protein
MTLRGKNLMKKNQNLGWKAFVADTIAIVLIALSF